MLTASEALLVAEVAHLYLFGSGELCATSDNSLSQTLDEALFNFINNSDKFLSILFIYFSYLRSFPSFNRQA